MLTAASGFGLIAFCWPLLVSADSPLAHGTTAMWLFALLLPVVLAVVLVEISNGQLDAKAVAMLGVLSAVGAAIRPLGGGAGGVELVFFPLVLAGRVFGPGFGFVLGNTTLFASALLTAGVGPWLPYQMLGAGWCGLGAGLLPKTHGRAEVLLLAGYGMVASLGYGVLLNLSFWPFVVGPDTSLSFVPDAPLVENLARLFAFSLATSLGWDLVRALTTGIVVLLIGGVVLPALRRVARRAHFGESV